MIKYKITLDKEHSLSGEEIVKEFEGEAALENLQKFLEENGYDYNEAEVANITSNGGPYINLDGVEFTVEIIPIESPVDTSTSSVTETKEQKEVVEEIKEEEPEPEIEQTAFNNAELFITEYREYLIGKKIKFDDGDFAIITDVTFKENDLNVAYIVSNEFTDLILEASENDFQNLIDFNTVVDFHLVSPEEQSEDDAKSEAALKIANEEADRIQKEKEKLANALNKPEFRYYIVKDDNKIVSGYEYAEEAKSALAKLNQFGQTEFNIVAKKALVLPAEENENWSTDLHDWTIIEESIKAGVKAKDYSTKDAQKYFDEFKALGKHSSLVKAKLLQSLSKAQSGLNKAFLMASPERVIERTEECIRIQNELKRIISVEY